MRVGDVVKVKDWAQCRPCDGGFFLANKNRLGFDAPVRYAWNDTHHIDEHRYNDETRYSVCFVDEEKEKVLICRADDPINSPMFVLMSKGLEVVKEAA